MRFLFNLFKKLLVQIFRLINLTRLVILNALFFAIVIIIISALNQQEEVIEIADNGYLMLNLNGSLVEQKKPIDISERISQQLSGDEQVPLEYEIKDIVNTIKYAKDDPRIVGLILKLDGLQSASIDKLTEIGEAINDFNNSDKPVLAFSENYTQSQYYLASFADNITMSPNGMVMLQGFAVNRLYFKELLDNLLITPHVFKVGDYKSFVEPFSQNHMSAYSKEANKHWLSQLWQGYITTVLAQRSANAFLNYASISPTLSQLKQGLTDANGDTAKYAQSVGLVDTLAFYPDFIDSLNEDKSSSTINQTDYLSYHSTIAPKLASTPHPDKIAVIYGNGEIVSGYADSQSIADKSFGGLLDNAANNEQVKAVVIRLDTPGGSAFASENIRQGVLKLKKSGKKVIVSMGAVTASGGYWIASAADKIVTTPSTLTGSIGIFGVFATVDRSLQKLGINNDGVSTSPLSDVGITRPLQPEVAEIIQIGINKGYQDFIDVVADGRDMSKQQVESIAQGRVWTGVDAVDNGLADKLGNLEVAIQEAALLADISEYQVITIKSKLSPKQIFVNDIFEASIDLLPNIGQHSQLISLLANINQQVGFLTRLNDPQNRFVYCQLCVVK